MRIDVVICKAPFFDHLGVSKKRGASKASSLQNFHGNGRHAVFGTPTASIPSFFNHVQRFSIRTASYECPLAYLHSDFMNGVGLP
jgi:hypothetical protein